MLSATCCRTTTCRARLRYCLDQVEECVGDLPLHKDTLKPVREVRRHVARIKPEKLDADTLHAEVDRMQIGISGVHKQIRKTWFA